MSNYYAKQEGKARIAEELIKRGWKVYNYSPAYLDQDPGCDYPYHAAHWEGLAEKNGFVLCVDMAHYNIKAISGKKVYKYTENNISSIDYNKIEALKNMTQERGATPAEEANAKAMIEKIYAKAEKADIDRENSKILDYIYPTFQEHPTSATKWHIEKDGSIYDKGNGLTTFAKVPDTNEFNIDTMEYLEDYKHCYEWENGERVKKERTLSEDQEKAIKAFKNFILRLERVVNSMNGMGDGTKETEEAANQQREEEKLIKITETVTKKVLKMVEVDRDYFQEGDYITMTRHGHYWKITREYMQKGTWKGVTESRKAFVYEIVGSASRGYQQLKNPKSYYNYEYIMLKDLEAGKTKIFELKEVEETIEVEKWVRKTIKKSTVKKETLKAEVKESNKKSEVKSSHNTDTTITATITLNEDKNGVEIRFTSKPDLEIRKEMKLNSFRWGGKNNNCWYAKQSETSIKFANDLVNKIKNDNNSNDFNTIENLETKTVEATITEVSEQQTINPIQEDENIININDYKEEKGEKDFMSILDKFDNIKIENTDRIGTEDKQFCKDQERIYNSAIELYTKFLNDSLELHQQSNEVGEKYGYTKNNYHYKASTAITYGSFGASEINDKINKIKNNFITYICDNFQKKYNITINIEKIQKKYKDLNVNYNLILDEIFEELGGFTFNEKAEQEIKEALKEKTKKWNSEKADRVTVNKTKITLTEYTYFELDWAGKRRLGYQRKEDIEKLFTGLTHFEIQKAEISEELQKIIDDLGNQAILEKIELHMNKVDSIRFYKNGKVDLYFKTSQDALKFAKEYLSLTVAA